MKKRMLAKAVALLAIGVLHGCGGGGGGGGGGAFLPIAAAPAPTPGADPAPAPGVAPAPAPVPISSPATSIKRALDTISPIAANGDLDVQLSLDLATATSVTYTLENPDGSNVVAVSQHAGTAGVFFPRTTALIKLLMPKIAPGFYVLRAKGQILDMTTSKLRYVEATLPIQLGAFSLNMASLSYSSGLIIGGSSRLMPLTYTSALDGTLYIYPMGQASGVCAAKTAAELPSVPNVKASVVTGSVNYSTGTFGPATSFADADTACLQFVRASDSVAETPYTFNFRYLSLPASGDLLFSLGADPATVSKETLSLISMPWDGNSSGFFNWLERRQVFTSGDVLQQSTANSSRISLEQAVGTWQYRLAAPITTDHPFYVAKVEGRPPMVFFVKP